MIISETEARITTVDWLAEGQGAKETRSLRRLHTPAGKRQGVHHRSALAAQWSHIQRRMWTLLRAFVSSKGERLCFCLCVSSSPSPFFPIVHACVSVCVYTSRFISVRVCFSISSSASVRISLSLALWFVACAPAPSLFVSSSSLLSSFSYVYISASLSRVVYLSDSLYPSLHAFSPLTLLADESGRAHVVVQPLLVPCGSSVALEDQRPEAPSGTAQGGRRRRIPPGLFAAVRQRPWSPLPSFNPAFLTSLAWTDQMRDRAENAHKVQQRNRNTNLL